jgi:ribosomal protein L40E
MKDIFDKLSDNILSTCKEVVGQTQKTADQAKYRAEMASLKMELKKLYQNFGKAAYEELMQSDKISPNYTLCNKITRVLQDIDSLQKKIDDVVSHQKDSFDAYKRDVKGAWYDEATHTTFTRTEDGVEILKICPHCNVGNPHDAITCINCHKNLGE